MTRSEAWAAREAGARDRSRRALPAVLPGPVLVHALGRARVPPLPRLAVDRYWAAHPLRADRLARALAKRSGAPAGWTWRLSSHPGDGLPRSFRVPPAPFREPGARLGPGHCSLCGQPVFRFGWHLDLWGDGSVNRRASWHACCAAAWRFWLAPHRHRPLLARLQKRRCAQTGDRLDRVAQVDHRVPLHEVWRDARDRPWPDALASWGAPNLRVVGRSVHAEKSAAEAAGRAGRRAVARDAARSADSPGSPP